MNDRLATAAYAVAAGCMLALGFLRAFDYVHDWLKGDTR